MSTTMQKTATDRRQAEDSLPRDLASQVETFVSGMSHGRIRDLQVACREGVIILRGRSRTQHDKQVAQEAAISAVDRSYLITNQIVVG